MAVAFTQFSQEANGSSAFVTKAIGATGSAGDWLSVNVVGGADGTGLDVPQISDNVDAGGDDWELLFSATAGVGAAQIRNTCWRKRCTGGETSVTATWLGNANKSITGFLATGVSLLDLYVIDRGVGVFNGTNEVFTITPGSIRANGESYVGQAAVERFGLSFASFLGGATAEGGASSVVSSACGTVAHTNNDGGATTDALSYGVRPEQAVYMSWLGISSDFGSTEYTDSATVTLAGVVSDLEEYTDTNPDTYDVGDASTTTYVRAGRQNVLTVATLDSDVTFKVQASPDGENWYDLLGVLTTIAVTLATPKAIELPPGIFYYRLLCTVAPDGPATCVIGTNGGY